VLLVGPLGPGADVNRLKDINSAGKLAPFSADQSPGYGLGVKACLIESPNYDVGNS
jgi:hypothetical protein